MGSYPLSLWCAMYLVSQRHEAQRHMLKQEPGPSPGPLSRSQGRISRVTSTNEAPMSVSRTSVTSA